MSEERTPPTGGSGTALAKSIESPAKETLRRLADPFPPSLVKWLPKAKDPNQRGLMPAVPYVEVGTVKDRLDDVLGVDGWETKIRPVADGVLICRLQCRIGSELITKSGVGAADKENVGASFKSADSDAIKRAAAAFGVGRYVSVLPRVYLAWDKDRKQFTEFPELPAWALPGQSGRPPTAPPDAKRSGVLSTELVRQFDAALTPVAYGVIRLAAMHAASLGKLTNRDTTTVLAADERAAVRLKVTGGTR